MKKKACKRCKLFFDGEECPVCKVATSTTNFKGKFIVLDLKKSEIAKRVGTEKEGEYAIKVT